MLAPLGARRPRALVLCPSSRGCAAFASPQCGKGAFLFRGRVE